MLDDIKEGDVVLINVTHPDFVELNNSEGIVMGVHENDEDGSIYYFVDTPERCFLADPGDLIKTGKTVDPATLMTNTWLSVSVTPDGTSHITNIIDKDAPDKED